MLFASTPEPTPADRAHTRFAWTIGLEAALCFAGPILMLLPGTALAVPVAVGAVVDPSVWGLRLLALVGLGWTGIAGVARILALLCAQEERGRYARLTLAGLTCGIAAASYFLWSSSQSTVPPGFMTAVVYLPLACTAHLVYLARRPLFH